MVARAMVLDVLAAAVAEADENDKLTFQRFAEGIADAVEAQEKRLEEKLQKLQTGKFDEAKKDRKRSEPGETFNGNSLADYEWKLNNHMETCFGEEGRRVMRWIREKAKGDETITAVEGKKEFADWIDMDRELWTQVMKAERGRSYQHHSGRNRKWGGWCRSMESA